MRGAPFACESCGTIGLSSTMAAVEKLRTGLAHPNPQRPLNLGPEVNAASLDTTGAARGGLLRSPRKAPKLEEVLAEARRFRHRQQSLKGAALFKASSLPIRGTQVQAQRDATNPRRTRCFFVFLRARRQPCNEFFRRSNQIIMKALSPPDLVLRPRAAEIAGLKTETARGASCGEGRRASTHLLCGQCRVWGTPRQADWS